VNEKPRGGEQFLGLGASFEFERQPFFPYLSAVVLHLLQEYGVGVERKDVAGRDAVSPHNFLKRLATALKGQRYIKGQSIIPLGVIEREVVHSRNIARRVTGVSRGC